MKVKTQPVSEAVQSMDPFKQQLVGLRVTDGVRFGKITRHECYDTDTCLVEKITVQWDDGTVDRKSPRTWDGEARGPVRSSRCPDAPIENRPAYLRAIV